MIDATDYLMGKIYRVFHLLKWTIFCVFHLIVLVALLFVLWAFQIQPHQVLEALRSFSQALHLTSVFSWLGFFGISGGALIYFYVKIWNKIFAKWSTSFMFKEQ